MASTTFSGPVTSTAGFIDGADSLVSVTTTPLAVTSAAHAGRTVLLDLAGAQAVTLPAATGTGNKYRFVVVTTATGDHTITAAGSDIMIGMCHMANDTDASASLFETQAATVITLNGTTTGGIKGATVELQDVATATWTVSVVTAATGVEASPFDA